MPSKRTNFFHNNPWFYFVVFTLANSVLSYLSLSNSLKLAIMVLGIGIPLLLALRHSAKEPLSDAPVPWQEFLPPIPRWAWVLLGFAVSFVHFFKLGALFPMPYADGSVMAGYSIDLSEHWRWKLFSGPGQLPPTLVWLNSLFFRLGLPSLLASRLGSAFLSAAAVPLFYWALRTFFSKSFGFTAACLMALSLWCFGNGRVCEGGVTLLPWELLCFIFLGNFLKETDPSRKGWKAALLGISAGLCYLVFASWPFVVLLIGITVCFSGSAKPGKSIRNISFFSLGFLFSFLPFLAAIGLGAYSLSIRVFSSFVNCGSWKDRFLTDVSYFSSLFWGPLNTVSVYADHNFEKLNPLWGAAFFMGVIQLFRCRSTNTTRWLVGAFLLCSFPVYVSSYVEMFRISALLPFLLLVTAWGAGSLLMSVTKGKRTLVLILFLAISAGLDGVQILKFYSSPDESGGRKSFRILKGLSEQWGPGLVFADFLSNGNFDLFLDTYDFNAAGNPRLDPGQARWAAISANPHYVPYLNGVFPGARWIVPGIGPADGDNMLGIFEVNETNNAALARWVSAQRYFHKLDLECSDISIPKTYEAARQTLLEGPALAAGDRMLESCYWEKVSEFYYHNGFQGHYGDVVYALQQAIQKGCPAAHLYYKLGSLYLRKKNFSGARKAFDAALKIEPNYADVLSAKNLLSEMEKGLKP